MNKKLKLTMQILSLSAIITACGGGEEKKDEPVKDTVTTEETPKEPEYKYTYKIAELDVKGRWAVTIGDSTTVDQLGAFFGKNFPLLDKVTGNKKTKEAPMPLAIYYGFVPDKKFYTVAAICVDDSTLKVKHPFQLKKLYRGKALCVNYFGAYEKTAQAYMDIEQYIKEKKYTPGDHVWEYYVTDPMIEKDTSKWQTDIYYPIGE